MEMQDKERDKSKEIEFFDRIASTWDANEIRSTPGRVETILDKIEVREGDNVLDLGTGTGVLVPYLSRLAGEEGSVVGIDFSAGMLSRAREKFGNLRNVRFERKDFENEEIEGKFELILLYCVYPHLSQPVVTLKKLAGRNLAPGGRIIIAFPSDEHFINNIHREKKADSDLLPAAECLAERLRDNGFHTRVIAYGSEEYVVEIKPLPQP